MCSDVLTHSTRQTPGNTHRNQEGSNPHSSKKKSSSRDGLVKDQKHRTRPKAYWDYNSEMTVEDELIFKGNKLVIPNTLRKMMLKKVHSSHQGIEKRKRLARDVIFWPGMQAQIADTVSRCAICNTYRRQNRKEPMIGHDLPERPWQKVATDIFELDGEHYLVVVDYYSNFIEVSKLNTTTSQADINICQTAIRPTWHT